MRFWVVNWDPNLGWGIQGLRVKVWHSKDQPTGPWGGP